MSTKESREQRNTVFNSGSPPAQPVQQEPQRTSTVDRVKAEFGLDIPVQMVPLPSNGVVYPLSSPFANKELIELRAMTTREEDILTNSAYLKKGTVITELIKSCINMTADPRELLAGDRNALMVAIRITGYGEEYDADIDCSSCATRSSRQFLLSSLPIKRLEISPVSQNMNLFEYRLPVSGKVVRFKFLNGYDEEEIVQTSERLRKLNMPALGAVSSGLKHSIVSVDGVDDRSKISMFVDSMPALDSKELRKYMRNNEPGITMRLPVTCDQCGHIEEVSMPITTQFFWPDA